MTTDPPRIIATEQELIEMVNSRPIDPDAFHRSVMFWLHGLRPKFCGIVRVKDV